MKAMKISLIDDFKKLLSENYVLGCFSKTTDSLIIEAIGKSGLDFVIIDMEHGPVSSDVLKNHIFAAYSGGCLPIVRVENSRSFNIGKALDLGAAGLQIPSVSTANEISEIISKSKFFPLGERGVCRFVKAADYGLMPKDIYFSRANSTLLIVQLEGRKALENVDEILKVEGYDILFIGPYDLSQSLGVPGDIEHPYVINAVKSICKKAIKNNIAVGTFCDTIKQAKKWKKLGVNYISYSVDIAILSDSLLDIKKTIDNEKK